MIDVLRKSIVLSDLSGGADVLPSQFRLFKAGVNSTTKGDVLFDSAAAAAVMKAFADYGNDLVVDLEHRSLGLTTADATDAMAWFKLSVVNGELWATDVCWTGEGARRLSGKLQRYISPAFLVDGEERVTQIINCGLVSRPATKNTPALIAASEGNMDPKLIAEAIAALKEGNGDTALTILEGLIVDAAGGEVKEEAPPEADPAVAEMTAAVPELLSATGAPCVADALAKVKAWALSAETVAANAAKLELSARVSLIGELVKLGAETPATAYADPVNKVVTPRLLSEDLASLRGRVAALKASKGGATVNKQPPGSVVTFSASDLAGAKKLGITPDEFIARKNAAVRIS